MLEELGKIDTADVDALAEIKRDAEALQKLVDKANASKAKVAPAIYARVMKDYDARQKALEDKARPLRQKARGEYTRLRTLHAQLKQKLDGAQLDQSELEFRHEIGELSDADFETRRDSAQAALAASQQDFDEADRISQRFLEVIPAVPEPPAPPPPPPPVRDEHVTADVVVPAASPAGPDFGTVVLSADDVPVAQSRGRLVEDLDGKVGQTFILGPTTSLGRTPDNDIPLDKPEVSRHHATIALDGDAFFVKDNGSGNGTYVNGERVTKHTLKDGDRIQVGTHFFFFREQ